MGKWPDGLGGSMDGEPQDWLSSLESWSTIIPQFWSGYRGGNRSVVCQTAHSGS